MWIRASLACKRELAIKKALGRSLCVDPKTMSKPSIRKNSKVQTSLCPMLDSPFFISVDVADTSQDY